MPAYRTDCKAGPSPYKSVEQDKVRKAMHKANGYPATAETRCVFTGKCMGAHGVHVLAHAEGDTPRLFLWCELCGSVPLDGTARDEWKATHLNLFGLDSSWHSAFADGAERKLIVLPIMEDLCDAVKLLERWSARTEVAALADAAAGRPWKSYKLDLLQVLQDEWPRLLHFEDSEDREKLGKVPMYRYRPYWFDDMDNFDAEAALRSLSLWDGRQFLDFHGVRGSNSLPVAFEPELPYVSLPAFLPHVVLVSTAHIYHVSERLPSLRWTAEFRQIVEICDYLLGLCESGDLVSWRDFRPDFLPFDAPPRPSAAVSPVPPLPCREYANVAGPSAGKPVDPARSAGGVEFSSSPIKGEKLDQPMTVMMPAEDPRQPDQHTASVGGNGDGKDQDGDADADAKSHARLAGQDGGVSGGDHQGGNSGGNNGGGDNDAQEVQDDGDSPSEDESCHDVECSCHEDFTAIARGGPDVERTRSEWLESERHVRQLCTKKARQQGMASVLNWLRAGPRNAAMLKADAEVPQDSPRVEKLFAKLGWAYQQYEEAENEERKAQLEAEGQPAAAYTSRWLF